MINSIMMMMGEFREEVHLVEQVKAEGNIEDWLVKLEKEMQRSVKAICKEGAMQAVQPNLDLKNFAEIQS